MVRRILQAIIGSTFIMACMPSYAAPGDTTVITSHTLQQMDWSENYDSLATFPDGTTSYRKIMMEFELGKYACPGYDPNNPGEPSDGGTGWCADWDYDVHIVAMNAAGDTIELGELITPYANSNFPATSGWSWKHDYWFDVTDFYNVLKNAVTVRIEYRGYSGGFTGTVRFHFIEGQRAKDVLGIDKMYHGSFAYGSATDPIESSVAEMSLTAPAGTDHAMFRTIITGHGSDSLYQCSEFCKKWLKYKVNGADAGTRDIWRDDCGDNWLAVQSGTWPFDRGNWCPGNLVHPFTQKLPGVTSGSSFTADIDFQAHTSFGGALYKMSNYVIYYGPYRNERDAAIEEVLVPNNYVEYKKLNPACGDPTIKVKNYGGDTVKTLKVAYGIAGGTTHEHTFDLTLAPDESTVLALPQFDDLVTVSGTNTFNVEIAEVNGGSDEEGWNNSMATTFTAAPTMTRGYIALELRTSGDNEVFGGTGNPVTVNVIDVNTGEIVFSRNATALTTTYRDTLMLDKGCYRIRVDAALGTGLAFFNYIPVRGYVRLFDAATGSRIPMPGNDMDHTGLEGNFGNGFNYYFTVTEPASTDDLLGQYSVNIFPNPAADQVTLELNTHNKKPATLTVVNTLGQVVYTQEVPHGKTTVNTSSFASGIYNFVMEQDGNRKTEKIAIIH